MNFFKALYISYTAMSGEEYPLSDLKEALRVLEEHVKNVEAGRPARFCEACNSRIEGREGKRYCNNVCKQAGYRRNRRKDEATQ